MAEYFYKWIENIMYYLVIFTVAIQLIPNNTYKKYIRFFMGLILIIMIARPIADLFGMQNSFREFYEAAEYHQKKEEIEKAAEFLEDLSGEIQ